MANKNIQESQQQSQNITIGTQGNEDITTPQSTEVSNIQKDNKNERHIPNQERSSASSAGNNEERGE